MTIENIEEIPLLEGDALDNFLGRIRNKEGRIVKYHRVNYNKRTAKKIIADMEYCIDRMRSQVKACTSRIEKNTLYTRIEARQRTIKYAASFINN
jgi:hypothetical protein